METKIIGILPVTFTAKDGTLITGQKIYYTEPLNPAKGGQGCMADKFFMTDAKLSSTGTVLAVGDIVNLLYNRYGKVESVEVTGGVIDYD